LAIVGVPLVRCVSFYAIGLALDPRVYVGFAKQCFPAKLETYRPATFSCEFVKQIDTAMAVRSGFFEVPKR